MKGRWTKITHSGVDKVDKNGQKSKKIYWPNWNPLIYLNDDSKVYYKNLILTSGKTLEKPTKTRKSLNYDKKIIQKNKREAVDVKNIIETKRTIKKNSKYSY